MLYIYRNFFLFSRKIKMYKTYYMYNTSPFRLIVVLCFIEQRWLLMPSDQNGNNRLEISTQVQGHP